MKESLRDRLLNYLKRHHAEWVASGFLQRLVVERTEYTPRTAVRRLEELAEEGYLDVEYRKNHAYYRFKEESLAEHSKKMVGWFDRLPT